MNSLIPKGLIVPPKIIDSESMLSGWQNKDGSLIKGTPKFIKDIYAAILEAVNDAKNETSEVKY